MKRHQLLIILMLFYIQYKFFFHSELTHFIMIAQEKGLKQESLRPNVMYASYAKDSNYSNKFRIYYADSNSLSGEGDFISVDKYDMEKNVYNNKVTFYYKNGNTLQIAHYQNGKFHENAVTFYENGQIKSNWNYQNGTPNGACINYHPNGLIANKANLVNGKFDGIYYEFPEDGKSCNQVEYKNGEPVTPYFTQSTSEGYVTKYKLQDGSLYLEMPTINEKQTFHDKGTTWDYYTKNGLTLLVSASANRELWKVLYIEYRSY